ncbi:MAG: hypothetical protein CMH54_12680 [Myxococcales bacterium]|nr:hypothetical protein [Myxococcales bacterium]
MTGADRVVELELAPPTGDERYPGALAIVERLHMAGYEAYLVGGCVRDMVLGRRPRDYDIATNAVPDVIEKLFDRTIAVGRAFGVMQAQSDGEYYEVATFRRDMAYRDGRRPEGVQFCDVVEDVARRDFTVNGLLYDTRSSRVVDYVDGLADLKKQNIRAIGDADARFEEDHLRILRAVRFSTELGFGIEEKTWQSVQRFADKLERISAERIRDEFLKILGADDVLSGLARLEEAGLVPFVLADCCGDADRGRLQAALAIHPELGSIGRLAALLVGVDQPTPEACSGCNGARSCLESLLPNATIRLSRLRLSRAENLHALNALAAVHGLRRFDEPSRNVWIRLGRIDGGRDGFVIAAAEEQIAGVSKTTGQLLRSFDGLTTAEIRPDLLLTGADLESFGYRPGPLFKEALYALESAQLDGAIGDRIEAERLVRSLLDR